MYDRAPWNGGEICRSSTTSGAHPLCCQYGMMAYGGLTAGENQLSGACRSLTTSFPSPPRRGSKGTSAPCRLLVTGPAVGLRVGDVRTRIEAVSTWPRRHDQYVSSITGDAISWQRTLRRCPS